VCVCEKLGSSYILYSLTHFRFLPFLTIGKVYTHIRTERKGNKGTGALRFVWATKGAKKSLTPICVTRTRTIPRYRTHNIPTPPPRRRGWGSCCYEGTRRCWAEGSEQLHSYGGEEDNGWCEDECCAAEGGGWCADDTEGVLGGREEARGGV
jgi:hypothetical protein